jgi:hypothetical protein
MAGLGEYRPLYRRSEWAAAWAEATRHGPEVMAALRRAEDDQAATGRERGGPHCCGTLGVWHRPWCPLGPWAPEEEPGPMPPGSLTGIQTEAADGTRAYVPQAVPIPPRITITCTAHGVRNCPCLTTPPGGH